jgi:hypothetical protein
MTESGCERIPPPGLERHPAVKLERCIVRANSLLDEHVLPDFLQDQLLLWTMEANSALKERRRG